MRWRKITCCRKVGNYKLEIRRFSSFSFLLSFLWLLFFDGTFLLLIFVLHNVEMRKVGLGGVNFKVAKDRLREKRNV